MLIVDCGSPRTPRIVEHVTKLGHAPSVVSLDVLEEHHVRGAPGIIFSGSPRMLSEVREDFFHRYYFLTEIEVPLFGICFGHQFIGMLHGATISRGPAITGPTEVWLENDPLFAGLDGVTSFVQDHEEFITMPKDFLRLASSDKTEVEAMRHRTKPIFSVQFHPEVSGPEGFTLFENFNKLCLERKQLNRG